MHRTQETSAPIRVAVVGHTNAGKTSLLRTLLRDSHFGEVANAAGTTRNVQGGALLLEGRPAVVLHDTPGLEDSIGLLAELEALQARETLADGPALLHRFLELQDHYPDYAQELKVVRQIVRDHLLFYVIDVREPLLAKYRDELTLLAHAARPIIPVLNFISQPRALTREWKDWLARMQLHASVEFDNVVFRFEDEKRLLQKMQSLLGDHYDVLQRLLDHRSTQWQQTLAAAARTIADALLRLATLRRPAPRDPTIEKPATQTPALQNAVEGLQEEARRIEGHCLRTLLDLFGFARDDVRLDTLEVRQSRWERDLFDRSQLRRFGLDAGSGAAKGAAIGAGVDLVVGGLSLGAASALGAFAGFLFSAGRRYGGELRVRLGGQQILCVDEATLRHLWNRQTVLLLALQQRGHATQTTTAPGESGDACPGPEARWLKIARSNPEWEDPGEAESDPDRQALLAHISRTILSWLQSPAN